MPGLTPMKRVMRLGASESVRWFVRWAYLEGGATPEVEARVLAFLLVAVGEERAGSAGWVDLRLRDAEADARDGMRLSGSEAAGVGSVSELV